MTDHNLETLLKKIESYKDDVVEMQKKLISLPAIGPENGGTGETEKAKYIEPIIRKYFDEVIECHAPDARVPAGHRPNYIAKFHGKDTSRTLWIMAHMDVVPAGDEKEWKTPPFEGVLKDGCIFGRGAEDNNQSIVSSLLLVKAFRECNIKPKMNIGILFVSDEEVDSEKGIIYVLEKQKSVFKPNDLILVPDCGDANGVTVEVAEKSIVWLKLITLGKQAHAAFPHHGTNANRAAANLCVLIDGLRNKYSEQDPLFDPPISTIEPTKREANVPNINTIPGVDVSYFDCRLLPSVSTEDFVSDVRIICKDVEKKFNVKITIEIPTMISSPATPADAPVIQAIIKAAKDIFNKDVKPVGIGGSTVCCYFRQAGFKAAVYSHSDETFHQQNEFCKIENIIKDIKVWSHIALNA